MPTRRRSPAEAPEADDPTRAPLQALRIPAGWKVGWNELLEHDPNHPTLVALGWYPNETAIFQATHELRRRAIDVAWRLDSSRSRRGKFRMLVLPLIHEETPDQPRGSDLTVDWDHPLFVLATAERAELVAELHRWLMIP